MTSRLTVLSGPSGVGKGSVVRAVRHRYPDVWVSVSATTRRPRPGERDGVDYQFLDQAAFAALRDGGALLEFARYADHWYGTPREPVEKRLREGGAALLEIELQGARQVRRALPDSRFVFLAPPSWAELERRLSGRGTEPEDVVRHRLAVAREEMAAESEFDVVVVNDVIESAADRLVAFMFD